MGMSESADRPSYSSAEICKLKAYYGNQARNTAGMIMGLLHIEVPELATRELIGNRFMPIPGKMHPVTGTTTPFYDHRGFDVALRERTFDVDGKSVKDVPKLVGYDVLARVGENHVETYASFGPVTNSSIVHANLDPRSADYDESFDMNVINALSTVHTGLSLAIAELRGPDSFQIAHEPRA